MIALSSNRAHRVSLCLGLSLLILTASRISVWAQTPEPELRTSQTQIAQELEQIHIAEQERRSEPERGSMWARLALQYHANAEFVKAEDAYNRSLRLLKSDPSVRTEYAAILGDLASLYLNYGLVDEAESVRKRALAVREKLGDPTAIGVSEVYLANVAYARHEYKKAERLSLIGMKEMESSSAPPTVAMLSGLITVSHARCYDGKCGEGLGSAQQAVAFAKAHFESESAAIGFALEALGFAEWKNGAMEDGEKDMVHAIRILRSKLVAADPRLRSVLREYGAYLNASSRRAEAQEILEEIERTKSQTPCGQCTVNVYSLSNALR